MIYDNRIKRLKRTWKLGLALAIIGTLAAASVFPVFREAAIYSTDVMLAALAGTVVSILGLMLQTQASKEIGRLEWINNPRMVSHNDSAIDFFRWLNVLNLRGCHLGNKAIQNQMSLVGKTYNFLGLAMQLTFPFLAVGSLVMPYLLGIPLNLDMIALIATPFLIATGVLSPILGAKLQYEGGRLVGKAHAASLLLCEEESPEAISSNDPTSTYQLRAQLTSNNVAIGLSENPIGTVMPQSVIQSRSCITSICSFFGFNSYPSEPCSPKLNPSVRNASPI
jgi:hypothetical protein